MHIKKTIFILICSILLLYGCKNAEQDVNDSVVYFYKNHPVHYWDVDRKLLSKELNMLLDKTAIRGKLDVDRIAKSSSPSDKPMLLEYAIFASRLEGEFGFAVNKINVNGNEARVVMDFTSTWVATNDIEKWSDEVILVNEDGWKVDDVIYAKDDWNTANSLDTLKHVLLDFINTPPREDHPTSQTAGKAPAAKQVKK
jgi:hypothetical protein